MVGRAIAFLFPGQGSQEVGMGRALAEASKAAAAVWAEADAALGFPLSRLCFEGPAEDLGLTANTQPAVLTASVAAAAALAERGVSPDLAAGHSLGEYSALVVAGALRFAEAVRLVRRRGEFMQEAVPVGTGAMAALMGVDLAAAEQVCAEAAQGEVVGVANINSPGQIVIAGHRSAVERAVAGAAARGARKSVMLPVSAPFHCALMKPAADRLAGELDRVAVSAPRIRIVRNVDGGVTTSADEVKPFLVQQVASPVRWTDCVERLAREGATGFLEVGPGRVLTGLLKRTLDGVRGHAVEDPASLEKAVGALTGEPA
ncbi:MAG TPA: ACP S-malonyltransferase [Verrucomicrobiae bacterium]|jgi:[acyl-carrier-protein] S-malonyltransferase|nr:ACP S-malonyltransferase [Verrucomicrobiae bacterium]